MVHSTAKIRVSKEAGTALKKLHHTVNEFVKLPNRKNLAHPDSFLLFHKLFTDLAYETRNCEIAQCSREDIMQTIEPARKILKISPFMRRIQDWPRGYPGDFETVEYMCHFQNKCALGTLAYIIEQNALSTAAVYQHRYKIKHQANIIKETVLSKEKDQQAKIGIIGCGGCEDLASIQESIAHFKPIIYLNDMDKAALNRAKENCENIKNLHPLQNNCLSGLRNMQKHGKFDLIVAGGLLDYFDLARTQKIVSLAVNLLNPGGKLFFTNIDKDHPFRILMEYFCNWFLLGKNEEELRNICLAAHIKPANIDIRREETGLTFLVTVTK